MNNNSYLRGSEWGIWDLQVQTVLDDRYESIENYYNTLKSNDGEKWGKYTDLVGGEEKALLYDSKSYFNQSSIPKKERCTNYVRNLFSFLNVFNPELKVIGFTDHNYYDDQLIDVIIEYASSNNCKALAGVEINVNGIHLLVYFNKPPYNKESFSDGIKTFLSKIDIDQPLINGVLNVSSKSIIDDVIPEITSQNGLFIYAHCNSDNGLFQERTKTDRTHLADIFNLKRNILLQGTSKKYIDKTYNYIISNNKFTSSPIFTIASDARCLNDIGQSDSRGNYQWIKSNPTFDGLRQIFYEPEERLFIGIEPELIKRVRERKTVFIESLNINQTNNYNEEKGIWFKDIFIPFNPGLCAIIGNRGQGKSAIADIIGLCGNSYRYGDFSFLNGKRFLKDGLASNFSAELNWKSTEVSTNFLSDSCDLNSTERIKYIPQNFFESLTNNLEAYQFEKTLENIVFSYLPENQKLGKDSFEELVNFKKKIITRNIDPYLNRISQINEQIILFEKKGHPDNTKLLNNKLKLKIKELEEHDKIKPSEVKNPKDDPAVSSEQEELLAELEKLNDQLTFLSEKIIQEEEKLEILSINKVELVDLIDEFEGIKVNVDNLQVDKKQILDKYSLDINKIIKFDLDLSPIENLLESLNSEFKILNDLLISIEQIQAISDSDEKKRLEGASLKFQLYLTKQNIEKLSEKMSAPLKNYQKYLSDLKEWKEQKEELEGDINKIDSKNWLENELNFVSNDLPQKLEDLRNQRIKESISIYNQKNDLLNIFNQIKNEIDLEISKYKNILKEYDISIEASLKMDNKFMKTFLEYIHQGVHGSFRGTDDGKDILNLLLKEVDFNSKKGIEKLLSSLIIYLENDQREAYQNETRYIGDQILHDNEWLQFYNYVFSLAYLDPYYELKLSNKHLSQLSPGEKGALLIVFYLLLDKDDLPLVIDQPEENLDNESIYKILTHFIKLTKERRQVIIVTHNPNLAIVGDAEQIIFVSIDKQNNYKFSFESGAIENTKINKHASDVLEGTLKAFDIRRLKYFKI